MEKESTIILKGAPVANKIKEEIDKTLANVKQNDSPRLGIIYAGENKDNAAYVKNIINQCEKHKINVSWIHLSNGVDTPIINNAIDVAEKECDAVILIRPLSDNVNDREVCDYMGWNKNVDCCGTRMLGNLVTNSKDSDVFAPCTAEAVMKLLEFYNIEVSGKRVVVIGRSLVIGKPLALLLTNADATVTLCHSKTENLKEITKTADIIVAAVGKSKMITKDYVKEGQILIDVGFNVDENGNVSGDIDFDGVVDTVKAITPVPGGIGSITTSVLMSHVLRAAKHHYNSIDTI